MIFNLSDTIAAISSAPGYGRRGIVRLSGELAADVVGKCWLDVESDNDNGEDFASLPGWHNINGRFKDF